jgi:hypothetical protein
MQKGKKVNVGDLAKQVILEVELKIEAQKQHDAEIKCAFMLAIESHANGETESEWQDHVYNYDDAEMMLWYESQMRDHDFGVALHAIWVAAGNIPRPKPAPAAKPVALCHWLYHLQSGTGAMH